MAGTRSTLNHTKFDCVHVTCQKHPNHLDLHNLWIGVFGFDFLFDDLVNATATPAAFKADVDKIIMNKIVAHISNKASHTDPANIPGVKTALEQLKFTIVHDDLFNGCKKFDNNDDFSDACRRIQDEADENDRLDVTVQLDIAQLCIDFNNFNFLDFAKHSCNTPFTVTAASAAAAAAAGAATPGTGALVTHGDLVNCMHSMGENIGKAVDGMKASHSGNKIEHDCVVANFQIKLQDHCRVRHTPCEHLHKQDLDPIMFLSTSETGQHKTDPSEQSSFMTISGNCFILQDVGPSAEKNLCSTVTKHCGKTVCEFHKWHTFAGSHMQ